MILLSRVAISMFLFISDLLSFLLLASEFDNKRLLLELQVTSLNSLISSTRLDT